MLTLPSGKTARVHVRFHQIDRIRYCKGEPVYFKAPATTVKIELDTTNGQIWPAVLQGTSIVNYQDRFDKLTGKRTALSLIFRDDKRRGNFLTDSDKEALVKHICPQLFKRT